MTFVGLDLHKRYITVCVLAAARVVIGKLRRIPVSLERIAAQQRPEYDFSRARPNPYAAKLRGKVIAVVLEPDFARAFPTSAAVNRALRTLARNGTRRATRKARRRTA